SVQNHLWRLNPIVSPVFDQLWMEMGNEGNRRPRPIDSGTKFNPNYIDKAGVSPDMHGPRFGLLHSTNEAIAILFVKFQGHASTPAVICECVECQNARYSYPLQYDLSCFNVIVVNIKHAHGLNWGCVLAHDVPPLVSSMPCVSLPLIDLSSSNLARASSLFL